MIDKKLKLLVDNLVGYMRNKYRFNRDPNIIFKDDYHNAKRILGKTGYYDPDAEEIVIFCTNRHPKDILRSIAHEIIHHVQKCEGTMDLDDTGDTWDENYILHNKKLKIMEAHAFLEGNLSIREWEALEKESGNDPIDDNILEEKKKTNKKRKKKSKDRKLTDTQFKIAKKRAASMEKEKGYSAKKAHKIAFSQVQKENINESARQVGEIVQQPVVVNDSLTNSVVYNKDDRACNDLYSGREELVFQELLKKFGIKK